VRPDAELLPRKMEASGITEVRTPRESLLRWGAKGNLKSAPSITSTSQSRWDLRLSLERQKDLDSYFSWNLSAGKQRHMTGFPSAATVLNEKL
jgi:hypothetical protein